MSLLSKILGDPNQREIKKLQPTVVRIGVFESELEKLSNEQLKQKTTVFKKQINPPTVGGKKLDSILPEAYALVREVAKRVLGQRHYDVQLIGGIVLHQAKIAEMKTGEGKTLASTLPVYLNALSGKGVHVVTVNDYLAKRDAVWMGKIYNALGLSIGVITHDSAYVYDEKYATLRTHNLESETKSIKIDELQVSSFKLQDAERDKLGSFKVEEEFLRPAERSEAYSADITYGTNNEFGFDYLRDNLVQDIKEKVQKGHHYAIVDEIDSILIDEARTPLIISAPDTESTDLYKRFARITPNLKEETDYNVDYKMHSVSITEAGIEKVEQELGISNLYDLGGGGGIKYVHNLEQALKAHVLFTRDKDYVVKDGSVIIVDEFTGRMMSGRRYSEGLHQAIEAKEGVEVQRESRTVASITFQNYFRMYKKLAGMTGTAITSAEEFDRVYKLDIVVVPTNKPLIRESMRDLVFRSQKGKLEALVRDLKERNRKGQPVLIGTTSIEKNEILSAVLQKEGIKHEVLNAKNHEREGSIIAQAGKEGAVTVATNMAGRGVDIILGGNPQDMEEAQRVRDVGGLHILATERHEARRIDDQLRGRSGRQGDPGSSQFYLSTEDEIMRIFGGDRIKTMMQTLKVPEDQPIENKLITNAIESAQKKIEGMNFDTRKHLLDYDEVLNKHREVIYKKRDRILKVDDKEVKRIIRRHIKNYLSHILNFHLASNYKEDWNIEEIYEEIKAVLPIDNLFHKELYDLSRQESDFQVLREEIGSLVLEKAKEFHRQKEKEVGVGAMRKVERWLILRTVDVLWMEHLETMNFMRSSVGLQAYAQRDPLVEYKNQGLRMFNELKSTIEADVVKNLFKVHIMPQTQSASRIVNGLQTTAKQKLTGDNQKASKKIGRNDPCYCGSGKKYKRCHGI